MPTITDDVTIDDLRAALDNPDDSAIDTVLINLVAVVASSADARLIAQRRAAVERLRTSPAIGDVDADKLARAVSALGLALSHLRLSAAAERSNREGGALLREIRSALTDAARPKDLIEQTGADPAQVARALRKLEDTGELERVPSPTGDGRERWYRLASRHRQTG